MSFSSFEPVHQELYDTLVAAGVVIEIDETAPFLGRYDKYARIITLKALYGVILTHEAVHYLQFEHGLLFGNVDLDTYTITLDGKTNSIDRFSYLIDTFDLKPTTFDSELPAYFYSKRTEEITQMIKEVLSKKPKRTKLQLKKHTKEQTHEDT